MDFEEIMEKANVHIEELNNQLDDIQGHITIYLREISDLETQEVLGFNIRNADLIHLLEYLDAHMNAISLIEMSLSNLMVDLEKV